jgi:hypothetical protein
MSVVYERWLLAKGNVFAPSGASVAKIVEHLRAGKWIAAPGSPELAALQFQGAREERARATGGYAVRTIENRFGDDVAAAVAASTEPQPATLTESWLDDPDREELRLVWPVRPGAASSLVYPLSMPPTKDHAYTVEIHRAPDFIYPIAKQFGALPSECRCGEDLAFEWDPEDVVPAFDASTGIFTECEECSRTFDPAKVSADLTNPFDGTKEETWGGVAHRFALKVRCSKGFAEDARLAFAPALVALLEKEFGRTFYEAGALSEG